MNINTAIISDAVTDAVNDAIQNALSDVHVSSHDIDTYSIEQHIEDAMEEAIEEAIEKDRKERKTEHPFTFSELLELRQGIHKLQMQDVEDRAAQFNMAIEFEIDFESDKWKSFKMKRSNELTALYDKLSEMLDSHNAK